VRGKKRFAGGGGPKVAFRAVETFKGCRDLTSCFHDGNLTRDVAAEISFTP